MLFPQSEFMVGSSDVKLGTIAGVPFYMSDSQFEYWQHTQLIIDVVPGNGGMFSAGAAQGLRFLTRSRIYTGEEDASPAPVETVPSSFEVERRQSMVSARIRGSASRGNGLRDRDARLRGPSLESAARREDYPSVTTDRLVNAQTDDGWLMFRRSYDSRATRRSTRSRAATSRSSSRSSPTPSGLKQGHEAPPIVNGRIMFVTTPMDHLIAIDATTGKVLWKYVATIPPTALKTVCCDVVNRGVALYGDMVYMATLDDHVIAFDAASGKMRLEQAAHARRAWATR